MSIKPILFNTEMVQAILDDRKTVTRRVVKPHNARKAKFCEYTQGNGLWIEDGHIKDYSVSSCWMKSEDYISKYAAYKPGDILWVRETFFRDECSLFCAGRVDHDECPFTRVENYCYGYRAQYGDDTGEIKWHPSIHMPKAAARLFLRVKSVRVERLREIDNAGAKAEGVTAETDNSGKMRLSLFVRLWNTTIKPADFPRYGWDANPWVWVIEFERCELPEDFLKEDADHEQ